MHRLESTTTREGKLRAACDRCHDLKNRCVRTGGGESRCDRCERLGIDCVYSNLSRIGRPRNTQRRPSKQSMDAPAPPLGPDDGLRPEALAEEGIADQIECSTTRIESPSNVMSLLMDPEAHTVAHSHATMDWTLDFSPQTPGHGILSGFQDVHATVPGLLPPLPPPSPILGQVAANNSIAEQNTEKLLQLQGHLHRLLWTIEKDPSTDLVEDSLEVIKTFMEILQSVLADNDNTLALTTLTGGQDTHRNQASSSSSSSTSGSATNNSRGSISSSTTTATTTTTSVSSRPIVTDYLTAQQALTCYSYMLLLLDRVVNQTTSSTGGGTLSSPSSLRLGVFSLASQPALNAEVVLHMVLRMVLRLRGLIQGLVAGFGFADGGSADNAVSNGSGTVSSDATSSLESRVLPRMTLAEGGPSRSRGLSFSSLSSDSSIAASLRVIADMVSERERLLLERLA